MTNILSDSFLIHNFLNGFISNDIISRLEKEVKWDTFEIAGKELCRTGCFQGIKNNHGDLPYLRCPSIDKVYETTDTIQMLFSLIPSKTNIVKIQKYNDGRSFISDHTDKIIDLEENSSIFNLRLGSTRSFVFTHKKTREQTIIKMPHNTMLIIGPETNKHYLHGVPKESDIFEPSYSLIFRNSVTFKDQENEYLYGPRSMFKEKIQENVQEELKKSLSKEDSLQELIKLFHIENNEPVDLKIYEEYIQKTCF